MDCVKVLNAAHADVNEKVLQRHDTPHDGLPSSDQVDSVKVLIAAGADVNARDNDGNTALSLANDCCEPVATPP